MIMTSLGRLDLYACPAEVHIQTNSSRAVLSLREEEEGREDRKRRLTVGLNNMVKKNAIILTDCNCDMILGFRQNDQFCSRIYIFSKKQKQKQKH